MVIGEFEDMLQGFDELGLFSLINIIFVGFTNRVVNEDELFLTHVDFEMILEFVLHLLNEVSLIECIALLPELYRLFVEGKFGEAHEHVMEEVCGEHLAEELNCHL